MILIVEKTGTKIRKKGERFLIQNLNDEDKEYPAKTVEQIIVNCGISLTSSAIGLAVQNNVDIVFFYRWNVPCARISPCKPGKNSAIRKKQVLFSDSK